MRAARESPFPIHAENRSGADCRQLPLSRCLTPTASPAPLTPASHSDKACVPKREPTHQGLCRHARGPRFWRGDRNRVEVRISVRSRSAMDPRPRDGHDGFTMDLGIAFAIRQAHVAVAKTLLDKQKDSFVTDDFAAVIATPAQGLRTTASVSGVSRDAFTSFAKSN
jgi:hypothetical protein